MQGENRLYPALRRLSQALWLFLLPLAAGMLFVVPTQGQLFPTSNVWMAVALIVSALINFASITFKIAVWKIPAVVFHIILGLCLLFTFAPTRQNDVNITFLTGFISPAVQTDLHHSAGIIWAVLSLIVGLALSTFDASSIFIKGKDFRDIVVKSTCSSCGITTVGDSCHFCDRSQAMRFYLHPLVPVNTSSIAIDFEYGSTRHYIGRAAYREGFVDRGEGMAFQTVSRYHATLSYSFFDQTLLLERTNSSNFIKVNNHEIGIVHKVKGGDIIQLGGAIFVLSLPNTEVVLAHWRPVNKVQEIPYWISFVRGATETKIVGRGPECDLQIYCESADPQHLSLTYEFDRRRFRVENLSRRENSIRLGSFELAPLEYDFIALDQTVRIQITGTDYLFTPVIVDNNIDWETDHAN